MTEKPYVIEPHPKSEITWQEAVSRLTRERHQAEMYVSLLKARADSITIQNGALLYAEAKGESDGVIRGLIVVLEQKGKPSRLSDLEQALRRSVEKRLALREWVVTLVHAEPDVRSTIADIIALTGCGNSPSQNGYDTIQ